MERLSQVRGFMLASAKDKEVRRRSSSGGAARMIISGALESAVVEKAYSLRKTEAYPWAEGSFWEHGDDVGRMPNSMYMPLPVMGNLKLNAPLDSLLVVGTACQLLAAERIAANRVERLLKVAVYCKQQKDFRATAYYAKRLGIGIKPGVPGAVSAVSYRGGGWPGRVEVNRRSIPWETAAAVPFGKRLWRVPGCRFCPIPFGHDADLTLLDPWGIRPHNSLGETLVIAWSEQGEKLIAAASSHLFLEYLQTETARKAINFADMRYKAALIPYYLGRPVSFRTMLAGLGEEIQAKLYEAVLECLSLPAVLHKLIAHAPDLRDLLLSPHADKETS